MIYQTDGYLVFLNICQNLSRIIISYSADKWMSVVGGSLKPAKFLMDYSVCSLVLQAGSSQCLSVNRFQ